MARTRTTPLRLHLFGVMHIERDGEVVHLARRQSKLLLAFLSLYPQPHPRDELVQVLGALPDQDGPSLLRTALTTLRRELGPEAILADRETVQLNPDFPLRIDAREFGNYEPTVRAWDERKNANSSAIAQLESITRLYRGDLLCDFYDDWVLRERERYRGLYLQALQHLVKALRMANEYERAIETARLILSADPGNESAYQHLMSCYLAVGNRQAALETYEQCVYALREDLAVDPSSETTALYLWLKQTPPTPSLAARITNLPIPSSSFIGRTRELAEIKRALVDQGNCGNEPTIRLVTLVGAGGSGKTRLAVRAATDLIGAFRDGVWWVELGSLSDPALVSLAVARSLGVSEIPGHALDQTLVDALRSKHQLLVLDNCEHLIDAAALLANELLTHCPGLTILGTSREPLNISGECIWSVPSLSFPAVQPASLAALLSEYESVRLFTERARATRPDFVLTDENAPAVAQICRRLDGLPLSIELAAVRIREMSPTHIASRLDDRFNLLRNDSREALPRQQTLRALIDWSHVLLSEQERVLFRRLAVFEGGWTCSSAEGVCGQPSLYPGYILDLLGRLVDKSLVIAETRNGTSRYRMLETIREYAREELVRAGELEEMNARHYAYFTNLAEEGEVKLAGVEEPAWQERLDAEHNNLRAALRWAFTISDPLLGLRLAGAMWRYWHLFGHIQEGEQWLTQALDASHEKPDEAPVWQEYRGRALSGLGTMAWVRGDFKRAEELHRQALDQYRKNDNQRGQAFAMHNIATQLFHQGAYESAIQYCRDELVLSKRTNDDLLQAWAHVVLGLCYMRMGNLQQAALDFHVHLKWARQLNLKLDIATGLHNLGELSIISGDVETARGYLEESLHLVQNLGMARVEAIDLVYLGLVHLMRQDDDSTKRAIRQALTIFREQKIESDVAEAIDVLAMLAYRHREFETSATLAGAADAVRTALGSPIPGTFEHHRQAALAALGNELDEKCFKRAIEHGRALTPEQAIDLGLQSTQE